MNAAAWGPLGCPRGAFFLRLEGLLGRLEAILGALGAFLGTFGGLLGRLESILGRPGVLLGRPETVLGALGTAPRSKTISDPSFPDLAGTCQGCNSSGDPQGPPLAREAVIHKYIEPGTRDSIQIL